MNDPIADLRASAVPPAAADTRLPVLPPLAALAEIVVLFGGLLALDWLQPALELLEFRPHPFWLPVLLVSLQYGTVGGLLTAAVAIALTVGAGFPEQNPAQTYFAYLIKIWLEPILWISAAVLIGQFRMRQIARKQQLALHVAELAGQRSAIADYARNLRAHCTALERQIAARKEPDVLLALQALDTACGRAGGAAPAIGDAALTHLMATILPGARASLYAVGDAGLTLIAAAGARPGAGPEPLIAAIDPLHISVVQEGLAVSVLSRDGEIRLGGKGIAAVPVRSSTDGRVVGLLKVDSVEAWALGNALLPALATVARALAPALEAAADGRPAHADGESQQAATAALHGHATRFLRQLRWFGGQAPAPAAAEADASAPRPATSAKR